MTGELGKRGMNPDSSLKEVKCYRDWLSRAYRGTLWEEENFMNPDPTPTFQRLPRDFDLSTSIYRVYEKRFNLSFNKNSGSIIGRD